MSLLSAAYSCRVARSNPKSKDLDPFCRPHSITLHSAKTEITWSKSLRNFIVSFINKLFSLLKWCRYDCLAAPLGKREFLERYVGKNSLRSTYFLSLRSNLHFPRTVVPHRRIARFFVQILKRLNSFRKTAHYLQKSCYRNNKKSTELWDQFLRWCENENMSHIKSFQCFCLSSFSAEGRLKIVERSSTGCCFGMPSIWPERLLNYDLRKCSILLGNYEWVVVYIFNS